MSQAFKKFQTLSRQVHGWKAKDAQKNKETELPEYPSCRGTFDTCPIAEEFNTSISKDKSKPPEQCRRCAIFKESKFYTAQVSQSQIELWRRLQSS